MGTKNKEDPNPPIVPKISDNNANKIKSQSIFIYLSGWYVPQRNFSLQINHLKKLILLITEINYKAMLKLCKKRCCNESIL